MKINRWKLTKDLLRFGLELGEADRYTRLGTRPGDLPPRWQVSDGQHRESVVSFNNLAEVRRYADDLSVTWDRS